MRTPVHIDSDARTIVDADGRHIVVLMAAGTHADLERIETALNCPPRNGKYPWEEMGHGDSILAPWTDTESQKYDDGERFNPSAASAARDWVERNRPGWIVHSRREDDERATRIWFLAPGDPS